MQFRYLAGEGVIVMGLFPLGRYGDNHVTPNMLFDPADPHARPPQDAVDVQFRLPSSLNAMLDGMTQARRDDLLDQWQQVFSEIAEDTAMFLQHGGYGVDQQRSGAAPARLAITAIMHSEVPGFDMARWHLHLYVGATATSLIDGHALPVAWDLLDIGLSCVAQARNINQVWEKTRELWGVRWDRPRPGALLEIVEPPWHEHIDTLDRGVCPGPDPWGHHEIRVADDGIVERALESEQQIARANAAGQGLTWAKLLFEDEDDDEADLPRAAGG